MSTTRKTAAADPFERLPDELLETIFHYVGEQLPLTPHNHARLEGSNTYYFDYSLQKPLLKKTHAQIFHLSLVCRRFHHIIHSQHFWERKCHQDHVLQPNDHLPPEFTAHEELYVNNPFHPAFNFIKPDRWTKARNTQSQIELVPHGSHRLYDEFNRLSPCRATSYTLAQFYQRNIKLHYPGLGLTDCVDLRPVIEFSICVAPRWDCGSRCQMSLNFSDGHVWHHEKSFPQWNDQKWHRITYRYAEYDEFPSKVNVHIAGQDSQFWAGFFGAKFAQARLRLVFRTSENGTNAESAVELEPRVETEPNQDPNPDFKQDDTPVESQDDTPEGSEEGEHRESDDESTTASRRRGHRYRHLPSFLRRRL